MKIYAVKISEQNRTFIVLHIVPSRFSQKQIAIKRFINQNIIHEELIL